MCGRTACALAPDDIIARCTYRSQRSKRREKPVWKDPPGGQKYYPSHNIAPASHTHHYGDELEGVADRVIQPMKWGLTPSWHKGDPFKIEYETNNCRSEGMLNKRTFKVPLERGRRCVILAEGFFEWKRDQKVKQPYYIYFPNIDGSTAVLKEEKLDVKPEIKTEAEDTSRVKTNVMQDIEVKTDLKQEMVIKTEIKQETDTETDIKQEDIKSENEVSDSPKLLTMAGVFDVWTPPDGGEPLYSYSVITVDASPAMAWIHHRMPAILHTEEEIEAWLDYKNIPLKKAVEMIRPTVGISMHPVSQVVNNSRNKTPDCVKPFDPKKPVKTAGSSFMMNWLGKSKKTEDEPAAKRHKAS